MKQHEREFFIAMIRSGNTYIESDNISLLIKPITIEQNAQANLIYNKAYKQAMIDEIMSEDEIEEWMYQSNLWTRGDEEKTEGLKNDLEKLKIEIYNHRNDSKLREKIRIYLRAGEKQIADHLRNKGVYYQNSREGYALSEKIAWIIKHTTYKSGALYDFSQLSLNYVVDEWHSSVLSENQIRELAREEPWKSIWSIKDSSPVKLFNNREDQELTNNQKQLILWSQIYDNIQESMDCPTDDVIKDDDVLDGWFIIQSKKREKERAEKEFEEKNKNSKIKNSNEVYVMVNPNDKSSIENVDKLNNPIAKNIRKQRSEVVKTKGLAYQHDFADEKQKLQIQATNAMRNNIKGGR